MLYIYRISLSPSPPSLSLSLCIFSVQFVHKLQTAVSEFCGYCRLFPHSVPQSEAIYSYIYIFDKCHQRFPLCVNRVVWTFVNLTWIHFAIFHCAIRQSCNDFMTSHIVKFALLYLVLFPPLPFLFFAPFHALFSVQTFLPISSFRFLSSQ